MATRSFLCRPQLPRPVGQQFSIWTALAIPDRSTAQGDAVAGKAVLAHDRGGLSLFSGKPSIRVEGLVLTSIVLLAAALRLYHLGTKSLWLDELNYARSAYGTGTLLGPFGQGGVEHPVGYLFLIRLVMHASRAEWALRLPALVASIGGVVALWGFARVLLGPMIALLAALLLALSSHHVAYGQEVHSYGLFATLSILILWAQYRAAAEVTGLRPPAQERTGMRGPQAGGGALVAPGDLPTIDAGQPDRARRFSGESKGRSWLHAWWPFILVATAALYSHYFAVFPVALSVLVFPLFWLDRSGQSMLTLTRLTTLQRAMARLALALLVVLILYLPQVVLRLGGTMDLTSSRVALATGSRLLESLGLVLSRELTRWQGAPLRFAGAALLLLLGLGWLLRRRRYLGLAFLAWITLPLLPIFWLSYRTNITIASRHLTFMWPVAMLLLAVGIVASGQLTAWLLGWVRLPNTIGRSISSPGWTRAVRRWAPALVPMALLLVTVVASGRSLASYYRTPKQDWKTVGMMLEVEAEGEALGAVVAQAKAARNISWYYPQVVSLSGDLAPQLAALCGLYPSVYLVVMPNEPLSTVDETWLADRFVLVPLRMLVLYYRNCQAGSWAGYGADRLFEMAYHADMPYPPTLEASMAYGRLAKQGEQSLLPVDTGLPTAIGGDSLPLPNEAFGESPQRQEEGNLAEALLQAGRVEEAVAAYQAIVDADPRDRSARMGLAAALAASTQPSRALAEYAAINAQWPDFPWAYLESARLFEELGQVEQALQAYGSAVRAAPGDATLHFLLAYAYRRAGQAEQAIAEFEAGLQLDPQRVSARQALEQLKNPVEAGQDDQ